MLDYGYHIVFTLHDMRNMTGGCHYSLSCFKYLEDCSGCPYLPFGLKSIPSKNLENFKGLLNGRTNQVHFIAPSKWMEELAISANLIPTEQIHFIPNIHPAESVRESNSLRIIKREKDEVLKIGIASLDVNSILKGGDLLQELKQNPKENEVDFLYLSEYLASGNRPETFWDDIDYLLVSSRADNSPNVIHEAKLRNIPVIGTKVGGITELLNLKFDIGIDPHNLTSAYILELLTDLKVKLGAFRPRFIDNNYQEYVFNALDSTISLYDELLS